MLAVISVSFIYLFIWVFNVTCNTVQGISREVVLWALKTSTYSWSRLCTVNCRPVVRNYHIKKLSHLRGGRQVCYHWPPSSFYCDIFMCHNDAFFRIFSAKLIHVEIRTKIPKSEECKLIDDRLTV